MEDMQNFTVVYGIRLTGRYKFDKWGSLFYFGNEIALRNNNQFQTYLTVNNSNFYQKIWGRNSKDIFLSMTDGLAHYNGTDIKYLFNTINHRLLFLGSAIFKDEVFFLVIDYANNLNLIYHGKLK